MALSSENVVVFIFNFVPLSQIEGTMYDIQINSGANYTVSETAEVNGLALIGSGLTKLASKSKLFFSQKSKSTFNITFKVPNTDEGKIVAKTLFQFDAMLRNFLNVPCQIIGLGKIMLLGYIDNSQSSVVQFESHYEYSFDFTERAIDSLTGLLDKKEAVLNPNAKPIV